MKIFYTLFNNNGEIPTETKEQIKNSLVNDLAKNHLDDALNYLFEIISTNSHIHVLEFGNVEILGLKVSNTNSRNNNFSNLKFENQNVYEMDCFQKFNLFNQ